MFLHLSVHTAIFHAHRLMGIGAGDNLLTKLVHPSAQISLNANRLNAIQNEFAQSRYGVIRAEVRQLKQIVPLVLW